MLRKTKILLFSCAAILLCICVVVGILYTLFTDSVRVSSHINSRNLDAVLKRTYLSYRVPDSDGILSEHINYDIVDFSHSTQAENNIFGLGQDVAIVPGSWYESCMSVSNEGSVAFVYDVNFDLNQETSSSPLADQLLLTVSKPDGTKLIERKPLSSIDTSSPLLSGRIFPDSAPQEFIVRVDFNASEDNNSAQNQNVYFDLSVDAVQDTKK